MIESDEAAIAEAAAQIESASLSAGLQLNRMASSSGLTYTDR